MKLSYTLLIVGMLILAGTAGAGDNDVTMPLGQILVQGAIGLLLFAWGVALANSDEQPNS